MEAKKDVLSNFDEQVKNAEQALTAEKSVEEDKEIKEDKEPKDKEAEKSEEVEPETEKSVDKVVEVVEDDKAKKSEDKDEDEKVEKSEDNEDDDKEEDKKETEKSEPKAEAVDEAEDKKDAEKSEPKDEEADDKDAEKSEPKDEEADDKDAKKSEPKDEVVEKDLDENGSGLSAFKSILTSSMGNISKSFEVSQEQNVHTNERLDSIAKSVSDLQELVANYFSTEKNLSEETVVPEPKQEEAEVVEDDKDVYIAEKSVAAGSVIQDAKEEEPKEEASKSVDLQSLYNKARSLRNAYADKYQAKAQAGKLTRAEYLEKSANVDDVTYGRNLDADKLNNFIEYASK